MKSKPRYVLDTNVVVSALLLEDSVPWQAFRVALDDGEILLSESVIEELSDVLHRPEYGGQVNAREG